MQSKDSPPDSNSTSEVGETPTSKHSPTPLRREAVMLANERQRGAVVATLCTLAGVGLGFGLSQMAATNNHCQHSTQVQHVRTYEPVAARVIPHTFADPIAKVTWLGVQGHTASSDCSHSKLQDGVQITRVFPGSPADAAGLEDGDLITGVQGAPVVGFSDLIKAVRQHNKGDQVSIEFIDSSQNRRQTRATLADIERSRLR